MKRTFGDFLNLPAQDQRDVWEKAADRLDALRGYVERSRPGCGRGWATPLFWGAPAALAYGRPTGLSHCMANRSGAARRPGRTHQLATIDRVPRSYAVGHRHQGAPVCALPPSVSTNRCPCAARPTYRPEIPRSDAEPLAIGHRGPSSRRHENGWLSGSLTAGLQDVQNLNTAWHARSKFLVFFATSGDPPLQGVVVI